MVGEEVASDQVVKGSALVATNPSCEALAKQEVARTKMITDYKLQITDKNKYFCALCVLCGEDACFASLRFDIFMDSLAGLF